MNQLTHNLSAVTKCLKQSSSHLLSVGLVGLAVLFCVNYAMADSADGWKLVKRHHKEQWSLYSREKQGSKFWEFRIVGTVDAPPEIAVEAVREKLTNDKYVDKGTRQTLLRSSKDEMLLHQVVKMPFPFKDREVCQRFVFFADAGTNECGVTFREGWDEYTTKPDGSTVRMPFVRGAWKFVPVSPSQSRVTHEFQFDPGGHLPARVVNSMAGDSLVEELRSVRAIAAAAARPDREQGRR